MKGTDPGRLQRQPSCLSPTASGTETHGGCDSRRCPVTSQKAACGGHGKVTTLRFSVPPLPWPSHLGEVLKRNSHSPRQEVPPRRGRDPPRSLVARGLHVAALHLSPVSSEY